MIPSRIVIRPSRMFVSSIALSLALVLVVLVPNDHHRPEAAADSDDEEGDHATPAERVPFPPRQAQAEQGRE